MLTHHQWGSVTTILGYFHEIPQPSITEISMKIIYLIFYSFKSPGANELIVVHMASWFMISPTSNMLWYGHIFYPSISLIPGASGEGSLETGAGGAETTWGAWGVPEEDERKTSETSCASHGGARADVSATLSLVDAEHCRSGCAGSLCVLVVGKLMGNSQDEFDGLVQDCDISSS